MKRKLLFISGLVLIALGAFFFFFRNKVFSPKSKVLKIGIVQPISHPGIDVVRDGIIAEFAEKGYKDGKNVTFDIENAQGDASIMQSIAQKFANSDYNLFIPIGTQGSQSLLKLISNRPIIFATVTDPVSAGLLKSKDIPGGNITGTSDMVLFKQQLGLLKKLAPTVKKVGVVYNPSEDNSVFGLQETKEYASNLGIQIITAPANNTGEVMAAARSITNKVDAFYMISDNTVVAAEDSLIKVAIDSKKPLISIEESGVEKGALATIGINYGDLGRSTADIAIRVLNGENPGNIPVYSQEKGGLFINTKTAKSIGLTIPEDLINQAKKIYQ